MKKGKNRILVIGFMVVIIVLFAFSVVACSPKNDDRGKHDGDKQGEVTDENLLKADEAKQLFDNIALPERNFSMSAEVFTPFDEGSMTTTYEFYDINGQDLAIYNETTYGNSEYYEYYELDNDSPKKFCKYPSYGYGESDFVIDASYCSKYEVLNKKEEALDAFFNMKNQISEITETARKCVYSGHIERGDTYAQIECTGAELPSLNIGIVNILINANFEPCGSAKRLTEIRISVIIPTENIPEAMVAALADESVFETVYNFTYDRPDNYRIAELKNDAGELKSIKADDKIFVYKDNISIYGGYEAVEKTSDIVLTAPAVPEGTSFAFDGWWFSIGNKPVEKLDGNKLDITHIGDSEVHVFANWKNDGLKIDFAGQELTEDSKNKLFGYLHYEDYAHIIGDLELKNGDYYIDGLYKDKQYNDKISTSGTTLIEGDVTLYAKVVPKIKFTFKGTDFKMSEYKCEAGENPMPIDVVSYVMNTESKVFKGWYEDAACTKEFDGDKNYTADTTLYAKYVPAKYTYKLKLSEDAIVKTKTIPEFITFENEDSLKELNGILKRFSDVFEEKQAETPEGAEYPTDAPIYRCTGWSTNAADKVCKKITAMPATGSTFYPIFEKVYTTDIYILNSKGYLSNGLYSVYYNLMDESESLSAENIDVLKGRHDYDSLLAYLDSLTSYKKFECEKKYNKLGWIVITQELADRIIETSQQNGISAIEQLISENPLVDENTPWPKEGEVVMMIAEEHPTFRFKFEGNEEDKAVFDYNRNVGGDLERFYNINASSEGSEYSFDIHDVYEPVEEEGVWMYNNWLGEETDVIWINDELKERYNGSFRQFLKANLLLPTKESENYESGVKVYTNRNYDLQRDEFEPNSTLVSLYTINANGEKVEIDYDTWPTDGESIYFNVGRT